MWSDLLDIITTRDDSLTNALIAVVFLIWCAGLLALHCIRAVARRAGDAVVVLLRRSR